MDITFNYFPDPLEFEITSDQIIVVTGCNDKGNDKVCYGRSLKEISGFNISFVTDKDGKTHPELSHIFTHKKVALLSGKYIITDNVIYKKLILNGNEFLVRLVIDGI